MCVKAFAEIEIADADVYAKIKRPFNLLRMTFYLLDWTRYVRPGIYMSKDARHFSEKHEQSSPTCHCEYLTADAL